MASEATATSGTTIIGSFEKLFTSSMRFSGAATLFSVQQAEAAFSILEGGEGFLKQMDKFGDMVESLTKSLAEEISPGKKDTLDSISRATDQVVRQSFDALSLLDPRQVLRLTNNLTQKTSETLSNWIRKKESVSEEKPKLAVDVLAN